MTQKTFEALKILIQSVITALLLFAQSAWFSSCVTNRDGVVDKTTNINISTPDDGFPWPFVTPEVK